VTSPVPPMSGEFRARAYDHQRGRSTVVVMAIGAAGPGYLGEEEPSVLVTLSWRGCPAGLEIRLPRSRARELASLIDDRAGPR
jgi:hypothetical protein